MCPAMSRGGFLERVLTVRCGLQSTAPQADRSRSSSIYIVAAWIGRCCRTKSKSWLFLSADRYVVQLLDVGWEAEPPYYVMEYRERTSL